MPYCKMNCINVQNAKQLLKAYHKFHPVGTPWEIRTKDNKDQKIVPKLFMTNAEPEGLEHRKRIMKCVFN
eukprot:6312658-Karenia_brevis.AAC.1